MIIDHLVDVINKHINLDDVINNYTKFPLNRIRTDNFELKLFNITVTLKCCQGDLKCYKPVKLSE